MGKMKNRGQYQSISLSIDFINEVKKYILKDSRYKSMADFARAAMIEKMDRDYKLKNRIKDYFTSKEEVDRFIEKRLKEHNLI